MTFINPTPTTVTFTHYSYFCLTLMMSSNFIYSIHHHMTYTEYRESPTPPPTTYTHSMCVYSSGDHLPILSLRYIHYMLQRPIIKQQAHMIYFNTNSFAEHRLSFREPVFEAIFIKLEFAYICWDHCFHTSLSFTDYTVLFLVYQCTMPLTDTLHVHSRVQQACFDSVPEKNTPHNWYGS